MASRVAPPLGAVHAAMGCIPSSVRQHQKLQEEFEELLAKSVVVHEPEFAPHAALLWSPREKTRLDHLYYERDDLGLLVWNGEMRQQQVRAAWRAQLGTQQKDTIAAGRRVCM